MKKLLMITVSVFAVVSASFAADSLPYSQQRAVEQAGGVAAVAPAAGEDKHQGAVEPKSESVLADPVVAPAIVKPDAGSVSAPAALAPTEATTANGGTGPHWNYGTGVTGPQGWGDMGPGFEVCKKGTKQSPVNISKFYQEDLPAIEPRYNPAPFSLLNNGHTLQFNYAPGSGFSVDGLGYRLKYFHFHTPSEHYMDGAPYPMELHFVHQADDGSLAVIGVMIKAGASNKFIEALWQNAPVNTGGEKTIADVKLSAADLMPSALDYYRYDGSLTTPPCTEGVQWFVLKAPIEASEEQIKMFQKLFPTNARPVQPLGDRAIAGD